MKSVYDGILKGKYPAKDHFRKVISFLKSMQDAPTLDHAVIYLEAAKSRMWPNCDQEASYRADRFFYYLTGCDLPDCHVVYDVKKETSTLFVPPVVDDEVIWSGLPLSRDEALKIYDVDEVRTSNEVNPYLSGNETPKKAIFAIDGHVSDQTTFLSFDTKDMTNLKLAIEECRVVKDGYEIALIKKANQISGIAHRAVLKAAKHANNERQLAAIFVERCTAHGSFNQAYSPIVASGTDASTLHYVKNNKNISPGHLNLLLDAGGEYNCYASDVTRTFPTNGKFTPESANIYRIVLDMQTQCMTRLKAGVEWDGIHSLAHKIAVDGLLKIGILKGKAADILQARTSTAFFPHGLGHFMGMDTHDTGGRANYSDPNIMFRYLRVRRPLPAGCVITVEPGIYFCRFIIEPYLKDPKHSQFVDRDVLERYWSVGGVRIEDDVMITENGFENLTNVPREMDELEALVAS